MSRAGARGAWVIVRGPGPARVVGQGHEVLGGGIAGWSRYVPHESQPKGTQEATPTWSLAQLAWSCSLACLPGGPLPEHLYPWRRAQLWPEQRLLGLVCSIQ